MQMKIHALAVNENEIQNQNTLVPIISKVSPSVHWVLMCTSILMLIYYQYFSPDWQYSNLFEINGFTLLIWTSVLFFSAVVSAYARNYLAGFKYQKRFSVLSLGFSFSVMIVVMSNHLFVLLISWFASIPVQIRKFRL
jgi:NAD(P)H-quinone oxidoreductase subunit 5